jgi:apolipoprotein N-acyltransferase
MQPSIDEPGLRPTGSWKLWAAAGLSAGLLELPFPFAGPLPPWRSLFAWIALAPLLAALAAAGRQPRPLRRGFQLGYLCGILWYAGNCYWVRDTMMKYGDMPPLVPELLLLGFSMILGLYFGLFGFFVALIQKRTGSSLAALAAAPVLWTALELAAARITSVPWDQLGYSQVDNALINPLATITGVYGIGFLIVAANAFFAGALVVERVKARFVFAAAGLAFLGTAAAGLCVAPPAPAPASTAVLIQPNLDVSGVSLWSGPGEWESHMKGFARLAAEPCGTGAPDGRSSSLGSKTYIAGIPETGAPAGEIVCPPYATHPDLVVWPESPAPYFEDDARLQKSLAALAVSTQSPLVIGTIGMDFVPKDSIWREYNSALIVGADGRRVGRYDKIHLVPFGEYVPFQQFLFFAHKLTGKVSRFDRGTEHRTFRLNGHRYGVFICYEAVFADEVREFAQLGAEALVNISDDGWYGDTSAPWQHLNMVRMRAIENRRWIVRATNNGVTASIDPYGRVRQSIPRHAEDALPAGYGFRSDTTFYTAHGDVFAWVCVLLSVGMAGLAARGLVRR